MFFVFPVAFTLNRLGQHYDIDPADPAKWSDARARPLVLGLRVPQLELPPRAPLLPGRPVLPPAGAAAGADAVLRAARLPLARRTAASSAAGSSRTRRRTPTGPGDRGRRDARMHCARHCRRATPWTSERPSSTRSSGGPSGNSRRREIRPHVMEWDEAQHFPIELLPRLAELGLMGIQIPEAYGGAGMSAVEYCICIEELARVDPSVALIVAAHNGLCTAHIFMFGTEAQKQRYVVPLARGEQIGAWGLTEPTAGSDAGGTQTRAVRDGAAAGCSTASKTFTTHGRVGHVMVVMAVTDRAAGRHGISAFIVERGTPGHVAPGARRTSSGCARATRARWCSPTAASRRTSCSGAKARASSTRCRCSTPGASASPRSPSASRRARTRRPCATRRSGGSSASRSPRSRRSSGSWPTTRRRSTRRAC